MKKVGILTLHYSDNYGAVLQVYALRRAINHFQGYEAEIINYVPKNFKYRLYVNNEDVRILLCQKRKAFEHFLQKECGVNTAMVSEVVGNQYDYYCVGSDQVWNLDFSNVEFFFPHLDENALRFSYAASIGMSIERTLQNEAVFQKYLPAFKAVSLREQEHLEFIQKNAGKECAWVLDPTLLLTGKDYETVIAKEKLMKEPFIFFFWLRHDFEVTRGIEFVNTISRKYHLPIVHTIFDAKGYTFYRDAGCMIYEGVENFLWYIKNASFVVTNSYHATLFSIQFRTPFYTFPVETMRSRIDTLKQKLLIDDRIVDKYISPEKLNENVDFVRIEEILSQERKSSFGYLKMALDVSEGVEDNCEK